MVRHILQTIAPLMAVLLIKGASARRVSTEGLAAFNTCKTQENVSDEELKIIKQGSVPSTTTGKCFLACMMEQSHLMKDGKYDFDQALNMAEGTLRNKRKQLKRAKDKIKTCRNQSFQETDRCEHAAAVAQCMKTS
ncbi:general odorant-binding protein 19d-like [Homalodisca vitripennis]|uniref:general odorant-binding protein 19d-like n=1 Tax=Homalodisca vitripennis TaxID=197043 RepID=UPI001EEA6D7B|nr:general odorant-binding protein 19d-like [Homalodisca vitripennis]XP_046663890.1 general odorant-binding protein 19d-like [Homalodisca vitripennis]